MAATKRASSSTTIPHSAIEDATMALQELPEKPRTEWPLRDAVEKMRDPLLAAMAKGYTYDDLAQTLEKQGVSITAASLKYYMTRGRKSKDAAGSKPRANARKPKDSAIAIPTPNDSSANSPQVLEPLPLNGSMAPAPVELPDDAPAPTAARPSASRSSRPRSTKTAAKTSTAPTTKAKSTTRTTKPQSTASNSKRKKAES